MRNRLTGYMEYYANPKKYDDQYRRERDKLGELTQGDWVFIFVLVAVWSVFTVGMTWL